MPEMRTTPLCFSFYSNVHLLELCWLTRLLPNHPMIIQEHPKFQTFCSHLPSFHFPAIFQSFSSNFLPFSCFSKFSSRFPTSQSSHRSGGDCPASGGRLWGHPWLPRDHRRQGADGPKRISAPLEMISIEILTYPLDFKGKSIENQVPIFQLKFLLKSHESHCLFCW